MSRVRTEGNRQMAESPKESSRRDGSRMAKYGARPKLLGRISGKTRALIILLAIFVFLVAALSVSIHMFVKADDVAAQAERLERVVRETDSLGEVLKASNGSVQAAQQLLPEHRGSEAGESSMTLYYTEAFEPSSKSDYKYRVSITLNPGKDGSCDSWQINWFTKTGKKAFYKLEFKSVSQ